MVRGVVHGDDDDDGASDSVVAGEADRVDNTLVDTVATGRVSVRGSDVFQTDTVGCYVPSCPQLNGDPLSLYSRLSCNALAGARAPYFWLRSIYPSVGNKRIPLPAPRAP